MKSTTTVKKNYEFRRMYAKGKSGVSSCLVVYYRKNRLGHNRLGVTVSTKLGHAVVRNRVRRTLREVYRLHHRLLVDLLALPPAESLVLAVLFRGTVGPDLHAHIAADLPRALGRMAAAAAQMDTSEPVPTSTTSGSPPAASSTT